MQVRREAEVVIKEAESEAEQVRLGREGSLLQAVAHPGVVQVVGLEGGAAPERPDRLLLHSVEGTCLADLGAQPITVLAGWGAAVATVLADLHDLGYAHGDIQPEHVLFDAQGRPVLCGFGSAHRVSAADAAQSFAGDVVALVRLLSDRLPPGEATLRRALAKWERARPGRRSGARALAATLVRHVPAAHVGPEDPVPDVVAASGSEGLRRARGRRHLVLMSGCLLGVALIAVLAVTLTRRSSRPPVAQARTALPAYVLRSAPGEEPVVVVGRWGCRPAAPAVLDARSGSVWLFTAWPAPGSTAVGHLVVRVPSADGLVVAVRAPGCDRLEVLRQGKPSLPVDTGSGR